MPSFKLLKYRGHSKVIDTSYITKKKDYDDAINKAKRAIDMEIYRAKQKGYDINTTMKRESENAKRRAGHA